MESTTATAMPKPTAKPLYEIQGDSLVFNFHPGQLRAWDSEKRIIAIIAGAQSGKTSFGPVWLWREIQKRGPGDYLVASSTYPLLSLKTLPEFLRFFKQIMGLGTFVASPIRTFTFSDAGCQKVFGHVPATPTHIFFGHASEPDSLESATGKAAWLDEAGQKKFKLGSYEAIIRRLSISRGRILITTTPYDLGWLKQKIHDPWRKANGNHPTIQVVRFDSTENPVFSQEEFDEARASLPLWKFNLFYRGIFTKPAGMIYESFDEDKHKVPRFAIPDTWQRYLGLDFGGVNTAAMFYAEEPGTKRLYAYREYKAGGRTAKQHVEHLLSGEPMVPICVGGSKSEGQWRDEFCAGGLPVREPKISDVEVGITRVYGVHAHDEMFVFDDLEGYLEQKMTYAREVDDMGEPTEKIEAKETFHFLDAERYIVGWLRPARRHVLRMY